MAAKGESHKPKPREKLEAAAQLREFRAVAYVSIWDIRTAKCTCAIARNAMREK